MGPAAGLGDAGSFDAAASDGPTTGDVATELGTARFEVVQNRYSLLERGDDEDVLPLCRELGISYIPYFPLASGLLTGKYRRGELAPTGSRLDRVGYDKVLAEAPWDEIERLTAFAEERGLDLLTVAIGGLAAQPTVASVIAGATSAGKVEDNVKAGAWQPTAEDLAALKG